MRSVSLSIAITTVAAVAGSASEAQAPPLRSISSTPTCARCRIVLERHATLRLPSDSLSYHNGPQFTRLANGSFVAWGLNETPSPVLFDSAGRFVRVVAGQGPGPGELFGTDKVFVGPKDSVWIVDDGGRLHVFTPELRFARTMGLGNHSDILFASDGRIVAAGRQSADRRSYPLLLLNLAGDVLHTFGVPDPALDPRRRATPQESRAARELASMTPGDAGTFWAWSINQFLLEQYDFSGRLLAQGRHALDGWYKSASERRPGRGEFSGLSFAFVQASREPGILWLVYHDRNETYKTPDPEAMLRANPREGMYDLVIEALDVRTFNVLASQRFPKTAAVRVRNGPDLLAAHMQLDDIFSTFEVRRLRLIRSAR